MKFKDEDIKEIARLIDEGWSYIKLACKFNMSKTNMNSLVRRYKMHGLEGILHTYSKSFTIEEKIAIINQYYSGESKSYKWTKARTQSIILTKAIMELKKVIFF